VNVDGPSAGSFEGRLALVTGGAGFIGSHLVDALLSRGARVRVLDDLSNGSLDNLAHVASRIDFIEGDIRDAGTCRRACTGVTFLFHEAARGSVPRSVAEPDATIAINVAGTANVFTAARDAGVERVVYASSSSVYGDAEALPKCEGQEGNPLSPYALSKVVNEELADVFGRCYGMQIVGLRYFNVYGPRQDPQGAYAAVIPRFFKACLAREAPVIYGDGEQSRDFTYVTDAVAANLAAAVAPAAACGRAYNVAGGRRTTVNELADLVRVVVGRGLPSEHRPERPGDIPHSLADLTRVRAGLGYAPSVELRQGLGLSAPHYRAVLTESTRPVSDPRGGHG
jgi:nucleoside-diphosphate-sugar epimerase